jgi:hypothetical protein
VSIVKLMVASEGDLNHTSNAARTGEVGVLAQEPGLAVLADHDERRQRDRFEGHDQRQGRPRLVSNTSIHIPKRTAWMYSKFIEPANDVIASATFSYTLDDRFSRPV